MKNEIELSDIYFDKREIITRRELWNKIEELQSQLAEKDRRYETLYKLFSEQHEIIDQNELGCFEEVNRLLKEQKDFYIVEKTEYDKMKQGAKDIVQELKQQLAEKEKAISNLNGLVRERDKQIKNLKTNKKRVIEHKNKTKISFALEQLEKVKKKIQEDRESLINYNNSSEVLMADAFLCDCKNFIDNQIAELTH